MAKIISTERDESGREYYLYDNQGEQWKSDGRWKKPPPGLGITTSERGRELLARRRTKAIFSHMRGLAKGAGIELSPDADFEQVIQGASDGIEALTTHMGRTFLQSENLRGMGEAWGKLTAPLLGAPEGEGSQIPSVNGKLVLLIATLADRHVIDGEARDLEPKPINIVRRYDTE